MSVIERGASPIGALPAWARRVSGAWRSRTVVPDWVEALNLAGPRVRTASWSWVLLLAGCAALLALWPALQRVEAEHQQAQADVLRLQRARHQAEVIAQAQRRQAQRDDAPGAALALDAEGALRAAQLMRWLSFPWAETLQQADEAAQQAQALMLGFSLDLSGWNGQPHTQAWARMSAAVRDDDAALKWLQQLGARAQLVSRDRLATPVDTAQGLYTARAELSWPGAAP